MPDFGDEDVINAFFSSDEDSELDLSGIGEEVTKNFKKTQSDLRNYNLLAEGHGREFQLEPSSMDPVGTAKTADIPMMISLVPPVEFPSGETKKRKIRAPQSIETSVTTIGDGSGELDGILARRDRQQEQEPPSVPGEGSAQQGEFNPGPSGGYGPASEDQSAEDAGLGEADNDLRPDPVVETEISVSNLNADSTNEAAFDEYISSLEERYKTLQKSGKESDDFFDEETTEVVEGRERKEDTVARRQRLIRQNRKVETTEDFLKQQVLAMRNIPPLIMYINPSEFSISYEQMISDGSKTRHGYIVEHWGLQQPTISGSGQIGAFYVDNESGGGLTEVHRRESAAFQSFMTLFKAYRNNAYIYNPDERISIIGSVRLFYDGKVYIGSFDEFSISESEDQPFMVEYDFSFTVRYEKTLGH